MTPSDLEARGLRVKALVWRIYKDRKEANGYLCRYHICKTDNEIVSANASHAASICAALEPIPPLNQAQPDYGPADPAIIKQTQPMDVVQAARVLSDALANDGQQNKIASGAKWGEAWMAMGGEYRAQGWTDWPAIFDAAIRAIADGGAQ